VKYFELGDQWKRITFVKAEFAVRIMARICRSRMEKKKKRKRKRREKLYRYHRKETRLLKKKKAENNDSKKTPQDANA
jgi:hypothetical protein